LQKERDIGYHKQELGGQYITSDESPKADTQLSLLFSSLLQEVDEWRWEEKNRWESKTDHKDQPGTVVSK